MIIKFYITINAPYSAVSMLPFAILCYIIYNKNLLILGILRIVLYFCQNYAITKH